MHNISLSTCVLLAAALTLAITDPRVVSAQAGSVAGRPAAAPSDTGAIGGRVFITDSLPAAGASVTLRGTEYATITDTTGRFLLPAVPAGQYELAIELARRGADRRVRVQPITVVARRVIEVVITMHSSVTQLAPVAVTAARPLHVIGHMPDVRDGVIYAGKKTEVIVMDSLHANLAQDVQRQILGRVPGANFSETAGAGFPSNGVGFRGLNPTQSVEVNVRQNGVNIAADVFGYPETYFTPPAEALERIEVVRGAGSLAFGPQFGGAINYVVRDGAPHSKPAVTISQTAGSYGLLNSFNAVGGGSGPWTYYAYFDSRTTGGWRPNSDFRQATGYGRVNYRASDRLTLGLEYTGFRNRIHMPGGLSDGQFAAAPQQSFRARNWLASPWNVVAAHADFALSRNAALRTTLSYMASERYLVWRNEDGGAAAPDAVDPATGTFVPREVERETFHHGSVESRLTVNHTIGGRLATLAAGVGAFDGNFGRFEGGPGSTGSDFNMGLYGGTWERALHFRTVNAAAFGEELVRLTDRWSLTPGVRYEYVRSTARGYTEVDSAFAPRTTAFSLLGIGSGYITSPSTELYANISQAYRPVLYQSLTPFGSIARVDPALHASRGYNADVGWRGSAADVVKFDVDGFYLWYGDRIGTRTVNDPASPGRAFAETANIGNSVHRGVEVYFEFDPLRLFDAPPSVGALGLFTSFAYVDARYVSGEFKGNRVEQAPRTLTRVGVTHSLGPVATTLQVSHTAASFGDANNSVTPGDNPAVGLVPRYTIVDWSGSAHLGGPYDLTFGINNLANARYFTKRTDEYPGPGILPGMGRSVYAGFRLRP